MRKLMTKEVTTTTIKSGRITLGKEGTPVVEQLPDLVELGDVSKPKAQKLVNKKYGLGVSIYSVETVSQVYEMEVEEFIKVAKLRTDNETTIEIEQEEKEEEEQEEEEKPKGKVRRIARVEA